MARLVNVLERLPHRDQCERSRVEIGMGKGAEVNGKTQFVSDCLHRTRRDVDPSHVPAQRRHPSQVTPSTTPKVQQPARSIPR